MELLEARPEAGEAAAADLFARVVGVLEAHGGEEPMSAFELLKSGLVEAMLHFLTASGVGLYNALPFVGLDGTVTYICMRSF